MTAIRVLIVDDSETMCHLVAHALHGDPEIDVVGFAHDPYQARAAIKALSPDVVTLDVEMPRMNGIEFLDKIMRLRPMPVIMISTLTHKGEALAVEALMRGAFECIGKPADGNFARAFAVLPDIVKAAGSGGRSHRPEQVEVAAPGAFTPNRNVVAIGASTGGVAAISEILSHFPANCPPTIIVQHMRGRFTSSFANRLDRNCAATVCEASEGMVLREGHVYLAPSGDAHLEISRGGLMTCHLRSEPAVSGHCPSVDVLFSSMATLKARAVGVLLTGMGRDGARGLSEIRDAGGRTIGQDKASSVVYGMPRIALELGAVEAQLPLSRIAGAILGYCNADSRAAA